ncbi:histidine kinase [Halosimplex halophilum]|uniref:histidine kinase n=1 Tax=Halosimplex halophilum TaxID=2559572 RepID=UPI00107F5368|nr:histidine kinase [Halosimplex halophilum]
MSTETPTHDRYGHAVDVVTGAVSGLAAGVFGSIVLTLAGSTGVVSRATPALVGIEPPAPVAGWLLFVLVSVGLGGVYAGVVDAVGVDPDRPSGGALAGAVYGLALWLVVAILGIPAALSAVGYAGAPPLPYLDPVALAGYVGFGAVVGWFHAALAPGVPAEPPADSVTP